MNNKIKTTSQCQPCQGGMNAMDSTQVAEYMSTIEADWEYHESDEYIEKALRFKNFSKTMFFVNALAHLADQQGHHPDVEFGYNYCRVKFTTHEANGLTTNDFICAKKVDGLI